jgi:hypothetical protein
MSAREDRTHQRHEGLFSLSLLSGLEVRLELLAGVYLPLMLNSSSNQLAFFFHLCEIRPELRV